MMQEDAQNRICTAIDPLTPDDAMGALIEVQAVILADHGILPRTPEFEAFAVRYLARLCDRITAMHAAGRARAH